MNPPPDAPPTRTGIKICGLTNRDDALEAAAAGATALGFNFWEGSKRRVNAWPNHNRPGPSDLEWILSLPRFPEKIAVLVNPSPRLIDALAGSGAFDALQFHGDESPEFCAACPIPWWKALPSLDASLVDAAGRFRGASTLLIDSPAPPGIYGGTGLAADRRPAADFISRHPHIRVFLAGGLHADNVTRAIQETLPHGVDVAGGVEISRSEPRRKDPLKLRAFVAAVRLADTSRHPPAPPRR